ncbi:hypothetical protein CPC08DRAFT_417891 [Agrocybe pediades]|nr:hypothetical protein CPC08DRAFT_417891 [Agrocybe pediades]
MSDAQDSATSEPTGRPKRACKPSAKIVDENNSEAIFSHRTATPVTSTQASPARVTHSTSSLSTSTTARSAAQQPQPGPIPSSSTPRLSPDHNWRRHRQLSNQPSTNRTITHWGNGPLSATTMMMSRSSTHHPRGHRSHRRRIRPSEQGSIVR